MAAPDPPPSPFDTPLLPLTLPQDLRQIGIPYTLNTVPGPVDGQAGGNSIAEVVAALPQISVTNIFGRQENARLFFTRNPFGGEDIIHCAFDLNGDSYLIQSLEYSDPNRQILRMSNRAGNANFLLCVFNPNGGWNTEHAATSAIIHHFINKSTRANDHVDSAYATRVHGAFKIEVEPNRRDGFRPGDVVNCVAYLFECDVVHSNLETRFAAYAGAARNNSKMEDLVRIGRITHNLSKMYNTAGLFPNVLFANGAWKFYDFTDVSIILYNDTLTSFLPLLSGQHILARPNAGLEIVYCLFDMRQQNLIADDFPLFADLIGDDGIADVYAEINALPGDTNFGKVLQYYRDNPMFGDAARPIRWLPRYNAGGAITNISPGDARDIFDEGVRLARINLATELYGRGGDAGDVVLAYFAREEAAHRDARNRDDVVIRAMMGERGNIAVEIVGALLRLEIDPIRALAADMVRRVDAAGAEAGRAFDERAARLGVAGPVAENVVAAVAAANENAARAAQAAEYAEIEALPAPPPVAPAVVRPVVRPVYPGYRGGLGPAGLARRIYGPGFGPALPGPAPARPALPGPAPARPGPAPPGPAPPGPAPPGPAPARPGPAPARPGPAPARPADPLNAIKVRLRVLKAGYVATTQELRLTEEQLQRARDQEKPLLRARREQLNATAALQKNQVVQILNENRGADGQQLPALRAIFADVFAERNFDPVAAAAENAARRAAENAARRAANAEAARLAQIAANEAIAQDLQNEENENEENEENNVEGNGAAGLQFNYNALPDLGVLDTEGQDPVAFEDFVDGEELLIVTVNGFRHIYKRGPITNWFRGSTLNPTTQTHVGLDQLSRARARVRAPAAANAARAAANAEAARRAAQANVPAGPAAQAIVPAGPAAQAIVPAGPAIFQPQIARIQQGFNEILQGIRRRFRQGPERPLGVNPNNRPVFRDPAMEIPFDLDRLRNPQAVLIPEHIYQRRLEAHRRRAQVQQDPYAGNMNMGIAIFRAVVRLVGNPRRAFAITMLIITTLLLGRRMLMGGGGALPDKRRTRKKHRKHLNTTRYFRK